MAGIDNIARTFIELCEARDVPNHGHYSLRRTFVIVAEGSQASIDRICGWSRNDTATLGDATSRASLQWRLQGGDGVGTHFQWHIGINETGARNSSGEILSPEVYAAGADTLPTRVRAVPANPKANWTLDQVADWLVGLIESETRFLVGINHRFSFPASYFEQQGLRSWQELLADRKALTDEGEGPFVEAARFNDGLPGPERGWRMTERWGNSLTCMFQFDVRGLNDSSHSALPWLRRIREQSGSRIHVWPFDGWIPPEDRSVIAEVHPLQASNCYPRKWRGQAEQNAYAISRWLLEADELGILPGYFVPKLPQRICRSAAMEGWILGVH